MTERTELPQGTIATSVYWLFKSHEDEKPEFVAEHTNFDAAYEQWEREGLMFFFAPTKQFFNVGEVIYLKMLRDGDVKESDSETES